MEESVVGEKKVEGVSGTAVSRVCWNAHFHMSNSRNDIIYASGCARNVKAAEVKMEMLGTALTQKCPYIWEVVRE